MGWLRISSITYLGFWIEIIIFIQIYWWLRSPGTTYDGIGACSVRPSGDVDRYSVDYYSYGRKSPYTNRNDYAWYAMPDGDLYYFDDYVDVSSYGRIIAGRIHVL